MGIVAEDFDDCIDELTTVIGEIQRLSRQISVQKVFHKTVSSCLISYYIWGSAEGPVLAHHHMVPRGC